MNAASGRRNSGSCFTDWRPESSLFKPPAGQTGQSPKSRLKSNPYCGLWHKRIDMLPRRNLIYTGITRGKKPVVLIGQKKALGIAVHNDRPQRRYSGLLASLKGERLEETTN